jgi:hypothetical protein
MRVNKGPLSKEERRDWLEYQINHYRDGGELLPPLGLPFAHETVEVLAAVLSGGDVEAAVAAAWDAFHADHPE